MRFWARSVVLLILTTVPLTGCEAIHLLIDAFKPKKAVVQSPDVGSLITPLDARELGYRLHWATDLGVPQGREMSHIQWLGDVIVAVEAPSNMVTAVSSRDGSMLWRRIVGKAAEKLFTPLRSSDQLLINSEQMFHKLAIDTGRMLEINALGSLVNHAPAVVGDMAIFGGMNRRVFAHSIQAGYTKWAYQFTERMFARPAVFGPNIFVADGNGVYGMFSAQTGRLLWKGRTFARVSARPAMSHLGVFVASEDHSLYALNGATGLDRWVYHSTQPLTLSPQVFTHTVTLPLPGQGLIALDARTGVERWRLPFIAHPIAQFEETLLVHTANSLVVLDFASGRVLTEVPVHPLKSVLYGPDRRLILVSPQGRLQMLYPLVPRS